MTTKELYHRKESDLIYAEILHLPSGRLITSYQNNECYKYYLASQFPDESKQTHIISKEDQSIDFRVPHYTNDSCQYIYSINQTDQGEQLVRLNLMDKEPGIEVVLDNFNSIPTLDELFVTHKIINCHKDELLYLKGCLDRGNGMMIILELNMNTLETKIITLLDMDIEMDRLEP